MARIFIAYSRQDRSRAEELVRFLESDGHSIWWDQQLLAGDSFRDVIIRAIDDSDKIIVLWSINSIKSEWTLAEAHRGLDAGKLIPICLPGMQVRDVPLPFNTLHTLSWGDFDLLKRAIGRPDTVIGKSDPVDEHAQYTARSGAERVSIFIAHASIDKKRLSGPLSVIVEMGFRVWIDKPEELDVSPSVLKKI